MITFADRDVLGLNIKLSHQKISKILPNWRKIIKKNTNKYLARGRGVLQMQKNADIGG